MIEELWGSLLGVKKWPEAVATVTSVDRVAAGRYGRYSHATIRFEYRPQGGQLQLGSFYIGDQSSLYSLDDGDTFPVQYNPAQPQSYFSSEYTIPFWRKYYAFIALMGLAFYLLVRLTAR